MSNEIALYKLSDMQVMAEAVAKSGLFGMKSHDQALALMLVAQAEGQHPATITQDYDIIQGKACRKTHSVMARFQSMGGKVEWHSLTNEIADATFSHPAGGSLRINWTIAQAKAAGLTNKDNWKNYPRAMLRARLIAEGVRAIYPAAIGGMLIAEEAADTGDRDPQRQQERDITPQPEAPQPLPIYSDADFEKNLPAWRELIASGKKTAERIIATVEAKATLTEEQKKRIATPFVEVAGGRSYAQVAEKMNNAQTVEDLQMAADFIRDLADETQQQELNALYAELLHKFE